MDNNTSKTESGSSSNEELARQIEKSEYTEQKNGREIYTAENGWKVSIQDQAGANRMVDWLRGTSSDAQSQVDDDTTAISPENAAHQEEMRRFRDQTTVGITGENIGGLGEPNRNDGMAEAAKKTLHEKEMETYEKEHNDGFDGKHFSQEGVKALGVQDMIVDLAKENKMLMERLDKMQATLDKLAGNSASTTPYEQDPELAAALDPNRIRPLNLLEQVQATLLVDQNKKQADFAKQVQDEDRLHNPLNPLNIPPAIPTPVTPEVKVPTPEKDLISPKLRKIAMIAGVVTGVATGMGGGSAVAGIGVMVCASVGLLNKVLESRGQIQQGKLYKQLSEATDDITRGKLEKRINNWEKIRKGSSFAKEFLKGAGIGLLVSGAFSGLVMGGHGLAWNQADHTGFMQNPTDAGIEHNSKSPITDTDNTFRGSHDAIKTDFEGNSFIKDGRVNLPGDSIDGQMAGAPDQNITGNPSLDSYGGPSQVAGYQLDVDLEANQIPDDVWNQMPQIDQHRIYNQYWDAAKSGNNNPDLVQELQKLGSEGAKKVLQFMGK